MALPQDGQDANGLTKVTQIPAGKELMFIDPTTNEGGIITLEDLTKQILNGLASQAFALDAGQMTLLAALNKLNSDKIKATTFKVSVNVAANKAYSTDISYQSISGEVLFSDVTWSNEKSDTPIYVTQYRTGACTISSISHKWAIDQKVSFIVAVLYI